MMFNRLKELESIWFVWKLKQNVNAGWKNDRLLSIRIIYIINSTIKNEISNIFKGL